MSLRCWGINAGNSKFPGSHPLGFLFRVSRLPSKEVSKHSQNNAPEGPRQEGGCEAQPGADGGTREEVALEIGFQETKDREFIPDVDGAVLIDVDGTVLIDVMMLMLMFFGSCCRECSFIYS